MTSGLFFLLIGINSSTGVYGFTVKVLGEKFIAEHTSKSKSVLFIFAPWSYQLSL